MGANAQTHYNAGNATALGASTYVNGVANSTAIGYNARAGVYVAPANWWESGSYIGVDSVALGANSLANRDNVVSIGDSTTGLTRQIVNVAAGTEGTDAVNLEQLNEVASNVGAVADRAATYDDASKDSLSLAGADGSVLRNLADGEVSASSRDAVNGRQVHASLDSLATALGGDSQVGAGGVITGTHYSIQGDSYYSVGDALGALDAALFGLDSRVGGVEQVSGKLVADTGTGNGLTVGEGSHAADATDTALGAGSKIDADSGTAVGADSRISANATDAVAVGARASVSEASGTAVGADASVTAQNAVALGRGSVAERADTVSVGSTGAERQITNVATGTAATDAANVAQVQAGDSATLSSANRYTDNQVSTLNSNLDSWKGEVNQRFQNLDRRLDKMSAMSGAYAGMAMNTAGLAGQNRVGVGVGAQGGERALAVGYQRAVGNRASVSLGGAFSGDEKSVMAGAGFSW